MIITKIVGGLGNQMFQYAIGKTIAKKCDQPLLLDVMDFKTYRRPYLLDRFNIVENYLADDEAKAYRRFETRFSPSLFFEGLKPISKRSYRLEDTKDYFRYVPAYLEMPPNGKLYLNGYWQNERYFEGIKDILLSEFTLRPEYTIDENPLIKEIRSTESIGLHFRRGADQVGKTLGVPELSYFLNGVELIAARKGAVKLFVFSNDLAWVKENFKTSHPVHFVSPDDGLTDYQELVALSLCKHTIISNSTFSWWAAWLNTNDGAITIAPKRWYFNDLTIPENYSPVPDRWIKL